MNPFLVDPPTEPLNVYSVGSLFALRNCLSLKNVYTILCFSVFFSRIFGWLFNLLDGLIRLYPQRIPVSTPKRAVRIPKHISYAKQLIAFLPC